jgi:digeranylgeranylglycerophospholipid reductase
MYDVVIVGAGVAGCRTAELAARRGVKVALLEEHADVGKPVQCAGLVSHRLKSMLPDLPDDVFLNKVKRAKFFYSLNGKPSFELKSKKTVHVIDRERLDKALFERAKSHDIKAARSVKFVNYSVKDKVYVKTNKGILESKLLVGADGPNSLVAKRAGLVVPDNKLAGVQDDVKGEFDSDAVELWFGNDVSPDFFGWLIPESDTKARIGIAAKKRAMDCFKRFSKERIGKAVKPDVGGMINFGIMDTATDRVMVVGDAACQVKPFSGGGVIYSLIGSSYCANACVKSLEAGDFRRSFLRMEYDRKWKWQLEGPIKKGMRYRKMMVGSDVKMRFAFNAARLFRPFLKRFDMDFL